MSVLRVYDPDECDEHGVPLDWEECRECGGEPNREYRGPFCPQCEDHGSLKAAVLARKLGWRTGHSAPLPVARCKDCAHPMSEGTWEETQPDDIWLRGEAFAMDWIMRMLTSGHEPDEGSGRVHYSRCDEGCHHGGPGRTPNFDGWRLRDSIPAVDSERFPRVEASWRPVDVRTLGWPHDLRPDKLAVLCLRCLAERGS